MGLYKLKIGFAITGAFYALKNVISQIKELQENGAEIIPIMSYCAYDFLNEKNKKIIDKIEKITEKNIIHSIQDAEKLGKKKLTDIIVISPCSGNTISKLATNIIDTPVTMAVKSNLRNANSIIIAISTNDGLGDNAENIGKLLNRKNYYFVPFKQDNPISKPRSIFYDDKYLVKTVEYALDGEQISPILL